MIASTRSLSRRATSALATGLLLLALAGGASLASTEAGAAAPQPGGNGPVPTTTGLTFPTADATGVQSKPKATAKPRATQPPVDCIHYTQVQWTQLGEKDPGPGGYWDCDFVKE